MKTSIFATFTNTLSAFILAAAIFDRLFARPNRHLTFAGIKHQPTRIAGADALHGCLAGRQFRDLGTDDV